jgi:hypothetical protein
MHKDAIRNSCSADGVTSQDQNLSARLDASVSLLPLELSP